MPSFIKYLTPLENLKKVCDEIAGEKIALRYEFRFTGKENWIDWDGFLCLKGMNGRLKDLYIKADKLLRLI